MQQARRPAIYFHSTTGRGVPYKENIVSNYRHHRQVLYSVGFFITAAFLRIFCVLSPDIPANFSPMESIALFSSVFFKRLLLIIGFSLVVLMLTDPFVNFIYLKKFTWFYPGFFWQYLSYAVIAFVGQYIVKQLPARSVVSGSIVAGFIFFIISNFGVWISASLYPLTLAGLIQCYVMAIPYFKYALLSNLVFSSLIYIAIRYLSGIESKHEQAPKYLA